DLVAWHREQSGDSERQKLWYATSFHLERLYQLTPMDRDVRSRLLEALRQTPASPAGRAVRHRLLAFDLARLAGVARAARVPLAALASLPAMSAATQPVPPLAPAEQRPPVMLPAEE